MEAVIKVTGNEFDEKLFNKIKAILKNLDAATEAEITIHISKRVTHNLVEEPASQYITKLNKSIKEIEDDKGVVFTVEELEEYVKKNFPG